MNFVVKFMAKNANNSSKSGILTHATKNAIKAKAIRYGKKNCIEIQISVFFSLFFLTNKTDSVLYTIEWIRFAEDEHIYFATKIVY